MVDDRFRLVTRSDFDGLVCAVLLKELDLIDDIKFVHPKDVQDGLVDIRQGDIITNLPYSKEASYVFDHHISELARVGHKSNSYINPQAPSAARVVWDTFGGKSRFANISEEMMTAVDKADSADYTIDDILHPTGWTLLSFIMDSRTGLGRFHNFRVSNYQLMMNLIDFCRSNDPEDMLEMPDVKERVDLYFSYQDKFIDQLKKQTTLYKNLAYVDLLNEDVIYPGNRFMIYALYPEINVSMHAMWRINGQRVVYAVGKSILNRTNIINIGELLLGYGGGGHGNVGTCQIDLDQAAGVKDELISILTDPQYNQQNEQ
ncbi:MAG: exopolyphosphatase [Alphaproteobacteria bacterium]|nr:exopolyphosphatase [Alphaproteobacteria bacterium]MBO4644350.1 exopolyphosphatase [Alphaproteobacteria bacterium]